jgi:signal transduction histidine kinase
MIEKTDTKKSDNFPSESLLHANMRRKSRVRLFLENLLENLFKKFIQPRSDSEDEKRKEFILNSILGGSIILLAIFDLFIAYDSLVEGQKYPGIHFIPFSGIVIFFCFLLLLSRKGYARSASYILVGFYFLAATYGMYRWGTGMQMALLTYVLIIVISSILVSTRFGFLVTLFLSMSIITISHLQLNGVILADWYWKFEPEHTHAEQFSIMFFLIMTISWLSNREIEKSLRRARKSERELIQERNQLESTVEKRTADLKQAQIEKVSELYRFAEFGRLSSGLFHDLMNPLTGVALNIQALNEAAQPDNSKIAETKHYLEKAVNASKRMESFISTIQKQIGSQKILQLFSPDEEIRQAIELLEYKARKADVRIIFKSVSKVEPASKVTLYGNALKFHQIAINLISNAIESYEDEDGDKDNKNRGSINKPENRYREKNILVELKRNNSDMVILSVQDSGCGIHPQILPEIFNPFFTTKAQHRGTGLGLSTTKTAVEKYFNGTINVTSKPGEGSTFTAYLPIVSKETYEKWLEKTHQNPEKIKAKV